MGDRDAWIQADTVQQEHPFDSLGFSVFGLSFVEVRDLPWVLFVEFLVEFVHFYLCLFQRSLSRFGQLVNSASSSAHIHQLRGEEPIALHAVQEWVERSRTYSIAMMLQFFHHCQAEQRLMNGVNQHVDANQTCKDFPLVC